MGLLEPSSGKLLVDNLSLFESESNIAINSWQKSFIHVPQEIYLSDNTIAENIGFGEGLENIDFQRVYKVAHQAKLFDFIDKTQKGFRTFVGERGIRLSGGQKQRIGIARALYKKSKLIILDEATSALDTNTEKLIMDELYNLGSNITIIVISHRKNTLEMCDKIYEIKNGKLIKKIKLNEDI